MSSVRLRRLCLAAALAALCCAATFLHIPYPLGYLNLGDCIVLLCAVILPPVYAAAAAGVGTALADVFLSYSLYAPATLLIKAGMALLACLLYNRLAGRKHGFWGMLSGGFLAEAWMVLGYFLYEAALYGFAPAGESALTVNLPQAAVNLVAAVALWALMEKSKLLNKTRRGIDHV